MPKEETTLKDVIQATFQQVWFSPPPTAAVQAACASSDGSVIKKERVNTPQLNAPDGISTTTPSRDVDGHERGRGMGAGGVALGPSPATPSSVSTTASARESVSRLHSASGCSDQLQEVISSSGNDSPIATISVTDCWQPQSSSLTPTQQHTEATAAQIVDVIASSSCNTSIVEDQGQDWLVQMLRSMLHDGSDSTKLSSSSGGATTFSDRQIKLRRASARAHCQQLVDCLMELLLQAEEAMHRYRSSVDVNTKSDSGTSRSGRCLSDQIVAIFVTLSAFCEAHPPYVIRHLRTLLPYLKGDNHLSIDQEAKVCLKLVHMLSLGFLCQLPSSSSSGSEKAATSNWRKKNTVNEVDAGELGSSLECAAWISQASDIAQDLTRISLKYGSANIIEGAISCLAQLCQYITHDPLPVHSLAQKCFRTIASMASEIHFQQITTPRQPSSVNDSPDASFSHQLPGSRGLYTTATPLQLGRLQRCIVILGFICEQTSLCPILNIYPLPSDTGTPSNFGSTPDVQRDICTSHEEDLRIASLSLVDPRIGLGTEGVVGPGAGTALDHCPYAPVRHGRTRNNSCSQTEEFIQDFPVWSLNGACFSSVFFLLHVDSAVLHARAVQALCSVFVGNPKLMIFAESLGLIAHILRQSRKSLAKMPDDTQSSSSSSGNGDNVHDTFLLSLKHVMVMEEKRLNQHAALDLMRRSGSQVVTTARIEGEAENSADASITGSILQHHLPLLLKFLSHPHPRLRCACLDLLGTLLSHGMIHPLDVIAWLIGLQGDPEESIRRSALHYLQVEDERHASFFDNRLLDGMEMAYTLQRLRAPTDAPVSQWFQAEGVGDEGCTAMPSDESAEKGKYVSIFAPLYNCCIRPHRKRRADYVVGILRRCDISIQSQLGLYQEHAAKFAHGETAAGEDIVFQGLRTKGRGGIKGNHDKAVTAVRTTGDLSRVCFLTAQVHDAEVWLEEKARVRREAAALISTGEGTQPERGEITEGASKKRMSEEREAQRSKKRTQLMGKLSSGLGNATCAPVRSSPAGKETKSGGNSPGSGTIGAVEEYDVITDTIAKERRAELKLLDTILQESVKLIQFLTSSIASIPFDTCEEPLYLIFWINRHLSMEIGSSNDHLRTALRVLGCISSSIAEGGVEETEECALTLPVVASDDSFRNDDKSGRGGSRAGPGGRRSSVKSSQSITPSSSSSPSSLQEQELEKERGLYLEQHIILPAVSSWLTSLPPAKTKKKLKVSPQAVSLATNKGPDHSEAIVTQLHRASTYMFTLAFGSVSREILLRLKEYLKFTYSLTDARCAVYCPLNSSSTAAGTNEGGGGVGGCNVGRFAGEMGIPVGLHFDPIASTNTSVSLFSTPYHLPSAAASSQQLPLSPPLWQLVKAAADDHNRLLLLLTEGDCDFNMTASLTRTRAAVSSRLKKSRKVNPLRNKSGDLKKIASSSKKGGKNTRRLKRGSSLNSITEGDEEESDSDCGESDYDNDASIATTPASSEGRTSSRKKRRTSKLGDFVDGGVMIAMEREEVERVKVKQSGETMWKINTDML